MKILIDIKHPAQLNLFKQLAATLKKEGWNVTITYLCRGKLPNIIKKEYDGFTLIEVGKSEGSKWSIFWDGNVRRTHIFIKLIKQEKYNICVSASSIPLAVAGKLTATPVIQFYDDPERKMVNKLNAFYSTKIFFPPLVKSSKKIGVFNCLKEWSYLSPKRFIPSTDVLKEYGLQNHQYIFVREVSNKSFNYFNQQDGIISTFADRLSKNVPVILSLEDKTLANKYPEGWIILKEPVSDIHSLIFYSKLVLSSGDSMAREGAMLGVNSIYCGMREMKANELLIIKGLIYHEVFDKAVKKANEFMASPFDELRQTTIRQNLLDEWDDMTAFMKAQIQVYKK